jgi:hypothetical protein
VFLCAAVDVIEMEEEETETARAEKHKKARAILNFGSSQEKQPFLSYR